MEASGRQESIALLALLRLRPDGSTWGQIANKVQLEGSATRILESVPDPKTLFEDSSVDVARRYAAADLAAWDAAGLDFIPILSSRYPSRLAGVFDAPPFLFAAGSVEPEDRGMSVVGSRRATPVGEAMARDAVRILADRGLTVVAGLAAGIDTIAHSEALGIGARTVAVIGTGINGHYPAQNRRLQDEISRRGLVLSQFYPDAPPTRKSFPMRNATMSGYGIATIVIEAGERSGTRIQARCAAEQGRPVILSKRVATTTEWGAEIARNPWVYVVSSRAQIEDAVDEVCSDESPALLRELGLADAR